MVVNSGIANACTGQEGYDCCQAVADAAAKELGIDASGVLIGSTGVIGMQLPVEKMAVGLRKLAAEKERSRKAGTAAAKAILTTDTCEKEIAATFSCADGKMCIRDRIYGRRPEEKIRRAVQCVPVRGAAACGNGARDRPYDHASEAVSYTHLYGSSRHMYG